MKEIVITNPNGITLHTKKSLVNDDIKIKLDKSIKAVDGVSVEAGPYGAKDLIIDGSKDFSGIVVSDYNGNLDVSSPDITDSVTNLNIKGNINISISDMADNNNITADGLVPENIRKGKTILGVPGTFEGGGNTLKAVLDATKKANSLFSNYKGDNLSDLIQYNDTENVTSFEYMYDSCYSATTLPLLNTSNGTSFKYMNYYCYKVTEFPLLNTSNGTNFNSMYGDCSKATEFPSIDTSNGTVFTSMYNGCSGAILLPKLNTDKGTDFGRMYYDCRQTLKIDISKFTSLSTSNSQQMFSNCYRLKAVIIRSFGDTYVLNSNSFSYCYWLLGTTHTTYNPNGEQGYIYVPRDMITTLQSATNWSILQFRALEDYTKDGTTTGEFDDEKAGI